MTTCRDGLRQILAMGVGVALIALATRTWVVQGLIVPVTVVSGSMAPRILGPHASAACRRCGFQFAVGRDAASVLPRANCPLCGAIDGDPPVTSVADGDQLLIDRTALSRGACPRRWQVVVFRHPDNANQYAAKRIVGLPGEAVAIEHGDVYVDGRIARKELPAQRAVAQVVHRAAWDRNQKRPSRWCGAEPQSAWQCGTEGLSFHPAQPAAAVDWLNYCHLDDQPVRDQMAYNLGLTRTLHPLTDLMLTCQVQAAGTGQLWLRADDGRQQFDVGLPSRSGTIRVTCDGRPIAHVPLPIGGFSSPREIVLSLFDSQLLLAIDNRVVVRYAYPPAGHRGPPPTRPLAIGARSLKVAIRQLTVWRDIYYTRPRWCRWGVRDAYQLGPDELFVLGDNSPISADSRSWQAGAGLPLRLLVGPVVGVP